MQTRTPGSASAGSGFATSLWCNDHTELLTPCKRAQKAVDPLSVTPMVPAGPHAAPITAAGAAAFGDETGAAGGVCACLRADADELILECQ